MVDGRWRLLGAVQGNELMAARLQSHVAAQWWPYPKLDRLGSLESIGSWHTQGFIAAIAKASDIIGPANQRDSTDAFFVEATDMCLQLLDNQC